LSEERSSIHQVLSGNVELTPPFQMKITTYAVRCIDVESARQLLSLSKSIGTPDKPATEAQFRPGHLRCFQECQRSCFCSFCTIMWSL